MEKLKMKTYIKINDFIYSIYKMTAIELLNELIVNQIKDYIWNENITISNFDGYIIFTYNYDISIDNTPRRMRLTTLVFELNNILRYKIYKVSENTGKLEFMVRSVTIDFVNDKHEINVSVRCIYVPITYFEMVPKELNTLSVTKMSEIKDIENFCRAEDICSNLMWTEAFRLRYPKLYETYITLGLPNHLNMASYLLYIDFENDLIETGFSTIPGILYEDFLDFYIMRGYYLSLDLKSLPRGNFTKEDRSAMSKVVFRIKYPTSSRIIESYDILNKHDDLRDRIMWSSINKYGGYVNEISYHMLDAFHNDEIIDASIILSDYQSLNRVPHTEDECYMLNFFLLTLNFKDVDFHDQQILDNLMHLLDDIKVANRRFPKLHEMLRVYLNKIKVENAQLYDSIISSCISPSDDNKDICDLINKLNL